jgi:hypothetical protein
MRLGARSLSRPAADFMIMIRLGITSCKRMQMLNHPRTRRTIILLNLYVFSPNYESEIPAASFDHSRHLILPWPSASISAAHSSGCERGRCGRCVGHEDLCQSVLRMCRCTSSASSSGAIARRQSEPWHTSKISQRNQTREAQRPSKWGLGACVLVSFSATRWLDSTSIVSDHEIAFESCCSAMYGVE